MAIAKNGILGGFSGSVGDIVGSNWKGVNTIRSKSAIEKKPLTQKQKDALQTTKLVLDFWKETNTMYPWLDLTSNELGMTPMNVFQRKYRSNVLASATSWKPFAPFNLVQKKILKNGYINRMRWVLAYYRGRKFPVKFLICRTG